jgi:nickel-dependent lactate racemase
MTLAGGRDGPAPFRVPASTWDEIAMQVAVAYQDEQLALEIPDDRLVGVWHGPASVPESEVEGLIREALERPLGYPALRQAVVPSDRVAIPFDPDVPDAPRVLHAICATLQGAGVDPAAIRVVATGPAPALPAAQRPPGVSWTEHDPEDRSALAYLASTTGGRRVYLNRHLTDADLVVPVGQLGPDPVLGVRGPWGVIFPGLSDTGTLRAYRAMARDESSAHDPQWPALTESAEVSWLLGSQFHVGVMPGARGVARVVAGLDASVREEGRAAVARSWTFRAESRADLVIAGIGRPGRPSGIEDLADGLATAANLVRRGGKIVILSRAEGSPGPALQRLVGAEPAGPAALRGAEGEADYPAARQVARALAWADVYLLSSLGDDVAEDLSMIPLGRPEEARRLAVASASCLLLSQADLTRAEAADEFD